MTVEPLNVLQQSSPPPIPLSPSLAGATLSSLHAYFASVGHRPGEAHWAALEDIAHTLQQMAEGVCPPKVLLSSIDPGVGKTQTVVHFARCLAGDDAHDGVGMIVCVGRIDEAISLARGLCIPAYKLAVLTADDGANALGGALPNDAQVLITTQQRIERACEDRSFRSVTSFHYRGAVRQVRVWDEAWLPGRTAILDRYGLLQILKPIYRQSPALARAIEDFADTLRTVADGELVSVPEFTTGLDAALSDTLARAGGITGQWREDQQSTITALAAMSGKTARAKPDGAHGSTLLTYKDTLPADLAPLLVLDASGRVRQTYADMQRHRGSVEPLRAAVKDYSPLTIRTWKTSGSKEGWGPPPHGCLRHSVSGRSPPQG